MIVHAQIHHDGVSCTATCTKCQRECKHVGDNTKRERQQAALAMLAKECEEHNRYVPQVIPTGVKLWYHHVGLDKLFPLEVTGRTVHALCGAVPMACPIYVVADSNDTREVASDFAGQLIKWNYTNVATKPPGFTLPAKAVAS